MAETFDALIVGGGAAGLMCALTAGRRGRRVLVVEHANRVGKKILMSGGGRCNFTNLHAAPERFLSANPHFCKNALARYTRGNERVGASPFRRRDRRSRSVSCEATHTVAAHAAPQIVAARFPDADGPGDASLKRTLTGPVAHF